MARYTFNTQIKTSFLYSKALMNWIIFAALIFAWIAVPSFGKSNFSFLPFFILVFYNWFLYRPALKYWDMGGFTKMTVGTDSKVIIFDDRVRLKMADVERVRLVLDERPTMFWLLGFLSQYTNLVNGELIFKTDGARHSVIYVQYKKDVKKIISIMREMGKPCRIVHEELLDEGIPPHIWYIYGLGITGSALILAIVEFFKKIFSS